MIGFIVISEKNYLDLPQKSILCHSDKTLSEYAKSYCWIHGTSYVRKALQGKVRTWILREPLCTYLFSQATGCFVDQTKIESEEDAPVTAYYLWLPYLLTICFILARLPRLTTNKQTIRISCHWHLQLFFCSGLPGRDSLRTA